MLFRTLISILTILAAAIPALSGGKVENIVFLVFVSDDNGNWNVLQTNTVPNAPGRACYGWRAKVERSNALIAYEEILKLPDQPEYWSGENDPYAANEVSKDRTISTTKKFETTDDGSIGNQWCVAKGDPLGNYSMTILIEGEIVGAFDFMVVAPDGFDGFRNNR
ncbi:MAG: hypothetical protein GY789_21470 [Hyphomicrobiales bacterium]|nr:hypothetical protein [Hyphomicrobiales bacterium]